MSFFALVFIWKMIRVSGEFWIEDDKHITKMELKNLG